LVASGVSTVALTAGQTASGLGIMTITLTLNNVTIYAKGSEIG
jgi:hypothetical protein